MSQSGRSTCAGQTVNLTFAGLQAIAPPSSGRRRCGVAGMTLTERIFALRNVPGFDQLRDELLAVPPA